MGLLELFILAVGLSMDAFAVSVCKGLSVKKMEPKHALICGAYFGGFQALMPTIGYLLGSQFESMITQIDHWIAFVLLGIIGINMIKESREDEDEELNASFDVEDDVSPGGGDQYRCAGSRRDICVFTCKHRLGSDLHRMYDIYPVGDRREGR